MRAKRLSRRCACGIEVGPFSPLSVINSCHVFVSKPDDRGRSERVRALMRHWRRTRERVPEGHGPSKVRTLFEDAHHFVKVRILENPEDSFEDAQLIPRCARKVRTYGGQVRRGRRGDFR
jgi:hypothetical protein